MSREVQSLQGLVGSIQNTTDYAVLGGRLQANGMGEDEIGNLLGLVERTIRDNVINASHEAATNSVMSVLTVFVELMSRAHGAAANEILRELQTKTHGFGGARVHAGCIKAARDVLDQGPRHIAINHVLPNQQ